MIAVYLILAVLALMIVNDDVEAQWDNEYEQHEQAYWERHANER